MGLPALGYVVSYRALQAALDAALARARHRGSHGVAVTAVTATPATRASRGERRAASASTAARLAVVADGAGVGRRRHRAPAPRLRPGRARREALAATGRTTASPTSASRRTGPWRCCRKAITTGSSGRMTPAQAERALAAAPDAAFLAALAQHFGGRVAQVLRSVDERRTFPLALEFARPATAPRVAVIGNAAQALHPIAGQGFNLGLRDAYELAQASLETPREALGSARDARALRRGRGAPTAARASRSRTVCVAAVRQRRCRAALAARRRAHVARRAAAAKRAFTRAMLFGCADRCRHDALASARRFAVPNGASACATRNARIARRDIATQSRYNPPPPLRPQSHSETCASVRHHIAEQSRRRADGGRHRSAVPAALQAARRGLGGVGDGGVESAAVRHRQNRAGAPTTRAKSSRSPCRSPAPIPR